MRNVDEKELERFEIVRDHVHSKLQETGELDRLKGYIRRRLSGIGWKADMMKELRVAVDEIGVCNVTAENLYDKIAVPGKKLDERVKKEAIKKIKHCYKDALGAKANNEIDWVPDVLSNDTIGNNRYANEHRN